MREINSKCVFQALASVASTSAAAKTLMPTIIKMVTEEEKDLRFCTPSYVFLCHTVCMYYYIQINNFHPEKNNSVGCARL